MRPLLLSLLLLTTSVFPVAAQDWAVGGFDAVGYSSAGRPTPGRSDIVTLWKGKLWHFATEENRARFESDPRAFAPALEGVCPVSIVDGIPQAGDPRRFAVVGGRLYLLHSAAAEQRLHQDPTVIVEQARQIWRGR